MRVLVTGAAGNLGSEVCRALHRAGCKVVATDRLEHRDLPVPVRVANLLDRQALYPLCEGVQAVVHLGNHIDFLPPDPQMIMNENVAMNMNVFQAAIDQGARKLVFASSIQVVASVPRLPEPDPNDSPAYLPLDSQSPVYATNPYALSKQTGEIMLEYFARVYGVQTIALRLPWMTTDLRDFDAQIKEWENSLPHVRNLAFSFMSFTDAADLVTAIIRADLPGSRLYLPAARRNILGRPPAELISRYYPAVPLRKNLEEIDSLVDTSDIQRDTGWQPRE